MSSVPYGIRIVDRICCTTVPVHLKSKFYAAWIWILTFMVYAMYHLSRKPITVVKNVLYQNCSKVPSNVVHNNSHWCDWVPFDGDNAPTLLGTLDSTYLFAYAIGMFCSGWIAERSRLNLFLCLGMVSSGLFTSLFGLGYSFSIHVFWFYLFTQILCGFAQSSGWPGVVTAMGNWFGHSKRGLIMGIWNSHTSVGNILGSLIAAAFLASGWSLSFIMPGILISVLGIFVYFFLVPQPSDLGLSVNHRRDFTLAVQEDETTSLLFNEQVQSYDDVERNAHPRIAVIHESNAISFSGALMIPGVIEFSLSLFFSKLVSYTFLYWLPNFIFHSGQSSAEASAMLSTLFDVGGIFGGIIAGVLNDISEMPATTCSVLLIFAIPMLLLYQLFSLVSMGVNIVLLIIVGILVNGPYALITTAVSAELGTHSSLRSNAKALSTVTSIIDGTGSVGAALGPFLAGPISAADWNYVFYMLMCADVCSLILLIRLTRNELITRFWRKPGED